MQDQVQMKVGGGFMSAKEFVERYTDYEVLKITRRDVMSRFKDTVKEIKEIKKVTGRRGVSSSRSRDKRRTVEKYEELPGRPESVMSSTRTNLAFTTQLRNRLRSSSKTEQRRQRQSAERIKNLPPFNLDT